jgi:probable phosphoglycerate mutase
MFVIVRHGNTFAAGEPPRRIGARTDLPLTAAGVEQAHALGVHFAALGWRFRACWSHRSSARARRRAPSCEHLPEAPELEPADWLREIDHGPDENQPEELVIARIGAEALAAWDRHGLPPPGGRQCRCARAAWRNLFASR